MPELPMATNLANLHPTLPFELSDELPHFHHDNLLAGCDIG